MDSSHTIHEDLVANESEMDGHPMERKSETEITLYPPCILQKFYSLILARPLFVTAMEA